MHRKVIQRIPLKNSEEIALMREACQVTATILNEVAQVIQPGITTADINTFVHQRSLELGAIPAPLNYRAFQNQYVLVILSMLMLPQSKMDSMATQVVCTLLVAKKRADLR